MRQTTAPADGGPGRVTAQPGGGAVGPARRARRLGPAALVALLASALILLLPLPAVAADDPSQLPALDGVTISAGDLPGGFVVSSDRAKSFVDAAHALAETAMASTGAEDRNAVVLERRDDGGMEFVVSLLIAPISDADRAAFDASTAAARQQVDDLAAMFEGSTVNLIEGLRTGETRLAFRIVVPAQEITFEIVVARRAGVIEVVGHAWTNGTTPLVSLAGAAGTLDGRLAAAVGFAAPVFRPTGPLVPKLTTHIPTPLDISTDPAVVGTNLVLSAIALLLLTVSAKLATRLLAEQEAAILRRLAAPRVLAGPRSRVGALLATLGGRAGSRRRSDVLRFALVVLFYGVVFSLLEPGWDPLTTAGLWLFISLTIANAVVGTADDLVQWRVARRWDLPADLAVRPTNALLAVLSTVISRAAGVVPGLMFGTPEVLRLDDASLGEARARRLAVIGSVALVAIGGGAWLATIATTGMARSGPVAPIVGGIEALLLVAFAATVQNLFLAMIGLPGTVGDLLRRSSPIAWGGALLLVTFLFWHTLLNPAGDPSTALSSRNVQVTLGLVGVFAAVTFAAWTITRLASPRIASPATLPTEASVLPGAALPAIASPSMPPTTVTVPAPLASIRFPAPTAPLPAGGHALETSISTADGRARGRMSFRIDGAWVEARTELVDPLAMRQFGVFALLSGVAWFAPFVAYAVALGSSKPSVVAVLGLLVMALAWLAAVIAARVWLERYRVVHTVLIPAYAITRLDVGRDWNLGCLLSILLSPLIGLLYLVVARGRVVRIEAPLAADRGGPVSLRLKGSEAEARYLVQLVSIARATI